MESSGDQATSVTSSVCPLRLSTWLQFSTFCRQGVEQGRGKGLAVQ